MKGLIAVFAAVLLSGCAHRPGDCAMGMALDVCLPGTNGYNNRQAQLNSDHREYEFKGAADDQQCQSYGAKPGSDVYVNCRLQLDQMSSDRADKATEQAIKASDERQKAAQMMLLNNQKSQQTQPYLMRGPTTCTSVVNGRVISTACQ
jgi:hypothetical protein